LLFQSYVLPAEYRYQTKKDLEDLNNWEESVIDYISGMMDEYAIAKYKEFFGENSLNTLYLR
jgi:dGTP triphosphohydrolase